MSIRLIDDAYQEKIVVVFTVRVLHVGSGSKAGIQKLGVFAHEILNTALEALCTKLTPMHFPWPAGVLLLPYIFHSQTQTHSHVIDVLKRGWLDLVHQMLENLGRQL